MTETESWADFLAPGRAFRDLAEKAWKVPQDHRSSRYYCIGHGLGMADLDVRMALYRRLSSLDTKAEREAFAAEGVKLEDQFLILEDGVERMSNYAFDDRLGGRVI